jgi:DNA-directed RNA polymerase III subunit RPC1
MGKHGIKVDHRHIMLLADTMSFRGQILGITRFGIGKMRTSTLMLASFEQTADYLFNAAVESVHESVKGVSESIIWVSLFL